MFEVAPDLSGRWPTEAACFDEVMHLEGELFREFANRRTLRAELGQQPCFVKLHFGVGWPEIAKNLLMRLAKDIGEELAFATLYAEQKDEADIHEQRQRVEALKEKQIGRAHV